MYKDTGSSHSVADISFDRYIDSLPPELWNFILRCSMGTGTREDVQFSKADPPFSWSTHFLQGLYADDQVNTTKRLKRMYVISCLLSCATRECYFPVQLMLSDVVDKYTRS